MKKIIKKSWKVAKANPLLAIGLLPIFAIIGGVIGALIYLFLNDFGFRVIMGFGFLSWISIFSFLKFSQKFNEYKE